MTVEECKKLEIGEKVVSKGREYQIVDIMINPDTDEVLVSAFRDDSYDIFEPSELFLKVHT